MNRRAKRTSQTPTVERVISEEVVVELQTTPESVSVDGDVRRYIADLVRATREDARVKAGVSLRGTQRLFEAARAMAVANGRDAATAGDVDRIASPVLAHRLVLTADARVNNVGKDEIIRDIRTSRSASTAGARMSR